MHKILFPAALGLLLAGCGSSDSNSGNDSDGGGNNSSTGDSGDLISDCNEVCAEGSECVNGTCCEPIDVCGSSCCSEGSVCSFGECIEPGNDCIDDSDCGETGYCESTLANQTDAVDTTCTNNSVSNGKCLPRPPICLEDVSADDAANCLVACEVIPDPKPFTPELKYAWGDPASTTDNVMMTPIVIQLDDDNCDELVNERDIPEIVFSTFNGGLHQSQGTVRAISIIDGQIVEKWTSDGSDISILGADQMPLTYWPGSLLAAGNVDGLPGNEVVACTEEGRMRALNGIDGTELWHSENVNCYMPGIADVDQDGSVEIISRNFLVDGATGNIKAAISGTGANTVAYDVTGDGVLDLVGSAGIADNMGNNLATFKLTDDTNAKGNYLAIADLDKDSTPEIVIVNSTDHLIHIFRYNDNSPGNIDVIRENVDINGNISHTRCPGPTANNALGSAGFRSGGGAPTAADTNGDGYPDIAMAGGVGYTVFDGLKLMNPTIANIDTIMWAKETQDCSSARTGSSVFDFNGDGRSEVVYADEVNLHIYDGTNGEDLFETCNTNGTLVEYPVIADVDSDGRADILVASNSYSGFNCDGVKTTGIRIFGDSEGDWVRTRRVWNQHAYHVSNIDEDGTIPRVEESNHSNPKLNNYRQNIQPDGEFSASDLRVEVFMRCSQKEATIRVRNFGEASVPAGVPLKITIENSNGTSNVFTTGPTATTKPLYPAEAEDLEIDLSSLSNSASRIQVEINPDPELNVWKECDTSNNLSLSTQLGCAIE